MAAPSHPAVLPSGPGKALALVPGGGGQIQPIPLLQNTPQPSVTMVRVVTHPLTSIPLNGYSATSLGGAEGNGDFRGTETVSQLCFCVFHLISRAKTQKEILRFFLNRVYFTHEHVRKDKLKMTYLKGSGSKYGLILLRVPGWVHVCVLNFACLEQKPNRTESG